MKPSRNLAPGGAGRDWEITFDRASVTYPNGTRALREVSLTVRPGEMVAVVGSSGSGKSTLIRAINGLTSLSAGAVTVGPYRIGGLSGRALREARGHIGMIFQGFNLAERTDVFHNVLVGSFSRAPWWRTLSGLPRAQDRQAALRALESVGIADKAWVRAGALSGGQKQRVAIARALTQDPSVMLADEPVSALDPPTAHSVMGDLRRINRERGLTVIVNLHVIDLARQYTSRLIGLREGQVVFDGPTASASDRDLEFIYGRAIGQRDILGAP